MTDCPEPAPSEETVLDACTVVGLPFVDKVIDRICEEVGIGCSAECHSKRLTQELFTGVTLGSAPAGSWACEIGGRGELMGAAALCLLADLGAAETAPIRTEVEIPILGVLGTSATQEVGLRSFDPAAGEMQGFHAVSICVPLIGCIHNATQEFRATPTTEFAPAGQFCGDFQVAFMNGLEVEADDSDFDVGLTFPAIPIATPIGTIQVQPEVGYESHLKTIASPYQGPTQRRDILPGDGCPDGGDFCGGGGGNGIEATLADVYTGPCGVDLTVAATPWSSQLALGGRNPGEEAWDPPPFPELDPRLGGRPDLLFGCGEDELTPARNGTEKRPAGQVDAAIPVIYDLKTQGPAPLQEFLADFFRSPLELKAFEVFVEPSMGVRYASQFDAVFTEGVYVPPFELNTCSADDRQSIARVLFPNALAANAFFKLIGGLDFHLRLKIKIFGKTIRATLVRLHPTVDIIPEVSDSKLAVGEKLALAEARVDLSPGEAVPDPSMPQLTRLVKFSDPLQELSGPEAEQFIADCFETARAGAAPEPLLEAATPEERAAAIDLLEDRIEFPCNLCLGVGGPFDFCVVNDPSLGAEELERRSEEECELRKDEAGLSFCASTEPGTSCVKQTGLVADPDTGRPIRRLYTFLGVPQDGLDPDERWLCDSVSKSGCFDTCTVDPSGEQVYEVARSAVDLVGSFCKAEVRDFVDCEVDEDCDDGNPCTRDECEGFEFGCSYVPIDGSACDDGLFCTQGDACMEGRCVGGANPCADAAAAGPVCNEAAQRCSSCGNDVVDDGEACDGAALGVCTTGCLPPGDLRECQCANEPPACTGALASVGELWPPNHRLAPVTVVGVTDPDGDPVAIRITGVTQDEPTEDLGDGNACPDGDGVGNEGALVRVERSGLEDGRVYHVAFTAEDGRGGRCDSEVTVCVPHDRGAGASCVDQGTLFDSTTCASEPDAARDEASAAPAEES